MKTNAAIYAARKQLGMDDDTARDVYQQVTGKRSLRAMTEAERLAVVSALRAKGFKRASPTAGEPASKYRPILQALWIAGWNLGIVRDRSDKAMERWILRSAGVDHPKWIWKNAHKAIEGLKAWLAREGDVDWQGRPFDPPYGDPAGQTTRRRAEKGDTVAPGKPKRRRAIEGDEVAHGYRIACAQWQKLGNSSTWDFWDAVAEIIGHDINFETEPTSGQWILVMNAFGERIREVSMAPPYSEGDNVAQQRGKRR